MSCRPDEHSGVYLEAESAHCCYFSERNSFVSEESVKKCFNPYATPVDLAK